MSTQQHKYHAGSYAYHAGFAAGFAAQQMVDRDAGDFDEAACCQEYAAHHAKLARENRDQMMVAPAA